MKVLFLYPEVYLTIGIPGGIASMSVSRQKIWNSLIYKLRETFGLYRLIDVGHTV